MIKPDSKPWNVDIERFPADIYEPKGMLGSEERRCLYWLAKNIYSGAGLIVDAGAYIGSSAYCLARGIRDAGFTSNNGPLIHSFDYFQAIDDYVVESISRDIRPIEKGESYVDIFEGQNSCHMPFIQTYAGDFCNQSWSGKPVEILFIDICKSLDLNKRVIKEFFNSLIPGKSIVVHQDFYHVWHPYIHISMSYLNDHFEIIDNYVEHQSRVYLFKSVIPAHKIDRCVNYDFTSEEKLDLISQSAMASPYPNNMMLKVIYIYQALIDKNMPAFQKGLNDIAMTGADFRNSSELWAVQLNEVVTLANTQIEIEAVLPENKITAVDKSVDEIANEMIANYPSLHRQQDGSEWFLGVSGDNFKYITSLLKPGMRTVETGIGFTSLAFILSGCIHTAICPVEAYENSGIEQRIRDFCERFNVDHSKFSVINNRSQDEVYKFDEPIDFAFIDGDHAFPIPMIDFYYLARALKPGGIIGIDDITLWAPEQIYKVLRMDDNWEYMSDKDGKTGFFKIKAPWRDKSFGQQTFAVANSRLLPDVYFATLKK